MWIGYVNVDQIVSACSKCLGVVQALFNVFLVSWGRTLVKQPWDVHECIFSLLIEGFGTDEEAQQT